MAPDSFRKGLWMIELDYEMTYRETIAGPLPMAQSASSRNQMCWQIVSGTLIGPRINARVAMPGMDWMRLDGGTRRADLRVALVTDDGVGLLFHYDMALIKASGLFLAALENGTGTDWSDQYMRMVPGFIGASGKYAWLDEHLFLAQGRLSGPRQIEYRIFRAL
jgi:hypothetical protein